jgi:hypothetical protein
MSSLIQAAVSSVVLNIVDLGRRRPSMKLEAAIYDSLNALVTFNGQSFTHFIGQLWLQYGPWGRLLERVHTVMWPFVDLLGNEECPLSPLLLPLANVILIVILSTLENAPRLCHMLIERIVQGASLTKLNLRACTASNRGIRLSGKISIDTPG